MRRLLRGAAAGTAAAAVMGAGMAAAKRLGAMGGDVPPERIVEGVMAQAGVPGDAPAPLVAGAHLAFGATAGALYALLVPWRRPATAVPYALGVWAASYQGWVPALGVMPPASEDRRSRVTTMVAAHVGYGWLLGRLTAPPRRPGTAAG